VTYKYTLEDLLVLLRGRAPAKVDALPLNRRRVEYGLLSVGLKLHCLGDRGTAIPIVFEDEE
jgi:hypothetical protein